MKSYVKERWEKRLWFYFDLLADDHVDDAASTQVQYVSDSDHDGRTDAQRTYHPHVTQVGENGVVKRSERKHRYDGTQREQEHGYQKIGIRDAVAGTARPTHVLGYMHPLPHVVGFHFKRILSNALPRSVQKYKTRYFFQLDFIERSSHECAPCAVLSLSFDVSFFFFFSHFLLLRYHFLLSVIVIIIYYRDQRPMYR